ncbi:hypothetical protein G4G27_04505 [Sphingomonas sp. So64.6b]|uniref:hypothetical protein n=1 Tax=Sphingomonas sp. So64.6b TaxID=2997354 RepID=UPI0015FFC2F8|nr:hypothetical protein [Sphingomonas sp. So64.6b]QNA83348.1 hypothetical protein G4G27_04505 [Sphingomonas sp. So64.6b]
MAERQIGVRVRGRTAEKFLARHAISPEDAIDHVPDERDRPAFERLRAKGIVREVGPGRYWFDVPAALYDADALSRRMVPIAIVLALVVSGIAMLFYRG